MYGGSIHERVVKLFMLVRGIFQALYKLHVL